MTQEIEVVTVDDLPFQPSGIVLQHLTTLDKEAAQFVLFAMRDAYRIGFDDGRKPEPIIGSPVRAGEGPA